MRTSPPSLAAAPSAAAALPFAASASAPPALTLRAPLLGPESARLALCCGKRQLQEWLLDGSLEWAFDFRRAGSRRSHLRILAASILRLQQRSRPLTPREKAAQWLHLFPPVFHSIFPAHKTVVPGTELARVWDCSATHLHHLVDDALLEVVPKDYADRETRQFSRETIFRFMQSRRVK